MEISVIAPSGRVLRFGTNDDARARGVNSAVLLGNGRYVTSFQVGRPGYHEVARRHVVPAEPAWREYVGGLELVVATNSSTVTIATLRGPHHELMTVFGGPTPPRDLVRSVFLDVAVEDQADGMRVHSAPGAPLSLIWEDVTIVVQDRGTVHVPGPESAAALIPKWGGTRTRFGEVWRQRIDGVPHRGIPSVHDYRFVVGQPRAAAEVALEATSHATEDALLDWLDGLFVAWN